MAAGGLLAAPRWDCRLELYGVKFAPVQRARALEHQGCIELRLALRKSSYYLRGTSSVKVNQYRSIDSNGAVGPQLENVPLLLAAIEENQIQCLAVPQASLFDLGQVTYSLLASVHHPYNGHNSTVLPHGAGSC